MSILADLPTTPVFVIAMQRSGTNLLRKSLAQSHLFTDLNEVFDPFHDGFWNFRKVALESNPDFALPTEPNQTRLWTEFLLTKLAITKTPFTLIDVKYNSLHSLNPIWQEPCEPPLLIRWIRRNRFPVLHIVRKNLLDCYVSNLLACKLKIWVSDDDRVSKNVRFALDSKKTVAEISRRRQELELVGTWLADTYRLDLTYESMTGSNDSELPQGIIRLIGDLLAIDENDRPRHIPFATRKMGRSAEELVTNYAEIAADLKRNHVQQSVSIKKAA